MPDYNTALYEQTAKALDANRLRYSSFPDEGCFRMNFTVRSCLRQIIMILDVHNTYVRFTARPVIKADVSDEKAVRELALLLANANFMLSHVSFGLDLGDGEVNCSLPIRNNVQDMAESISFAVDATIDAFNMFGKGIINIILSGASGRDEFYRNVEEYYENEDDTDEDEADTPDSVEEDPADTVIPFDLTSLFNEDEQNGSEDDDDELDEEDFRLSLFDD